MNEDKKYKFSVVIIIYNSELWIKDAIESIVNQSIGMDNIQLILVDDESTDSSLDICKQYQQVYEENIIILEKKNGGAASSRNYAIPYIKGDYVEFLDGDDFISTNTLESVYDFFEKHKKEIDIISIPMQYFEGRTGPHYLNTKFQNGNRIIDLNENFTDIFVHVNSIFIKNKLIKKFRFDETLPTCEDGKMAIQLLLENPKYGVINNCQYNYRLRKDTKSSLSQVAKRNKAWYIDQIINYPLWSYKYCYEKLGYIPNFVKSMIASHLQWRFKGETNKYGVLTNEENEKYKELLLFSLRFIDDYIIDTLTQIPEEQKEYMKFLKKQYKEFNKVEKSKYDEER